MVIIRGIKKIRKFARPVVAVGIFDGVHLGHCKVLKAAVKKAHSIKGTSVALTFWPHPRQEESLYSLPHRLNLIAKLGIDACVVINFNAQFARISAGDFVRDILVKRLHSRAVYVGENFRFGKAQEGNVRFLARLCDTYGFSLKAFRVVTRGARPVSSTHIRALIKKGKLSIARALLGRPVSVLGTVIKGASLARRLGFPTANIDPHHEVIPPSGVYAVRVIFNQKKLPGLCYIGSKPTLSDKGMRHIEVYILGFQQDIYGKDLEILFFRKLRAEKKFNSLAELAAQIAKDTSVAKRLF
jgi:riboflavin kinase/FMN adenylyltransferase